MLNPISSSLISLVSWANAWLQGACDLKGFYPDNSVLGWWKKDLQLDGRDPLGWLDELKKGSMLVSARHPGDPVVSELLGPTQPGYHRWLISAHGPEGASLLGARRLKIRRLQLDVLWAGEELPVWKPAPLDEARAKLHGALEEARAFVASDRSWRKMFERALQELESDDATIRDDLYYQAEFYGFALDGPRMDLRDLLPPSHGLESVRLLNAFSASRLATGSAGWHEYAGPRNDEEGWRRAAEVNARLGSARSNALRSVANRDGPH